jgi:hypothetical protein
VVGPSAAGPSGAAEGGGAGVTVDRGVVGVIVVVVIVLLRPPPNPAAKTSMVRPPNRVIAVLASDLIRLSILHRVLIPPHCRVYTRTWYKQRHVWADGRFTFISLLYPSRVFALPADTRLWFPLPGICGYLLAPSPAGKVTPSIAHAGADEGVDDGQSSPVPPVVLDPVAAVLERYR